jgi:hypothetical protein
MRIGPTPSLFSYGVKGEAGAVVAVAHRAPSFLEGHAGVVRLWAQAGGINEVCLVHGPLAKTISQTHTFSYTTGPLKTPTI